MLSAMFLLGIFLGFGCAVFAALSYLASRVYTAGQRGRLLQLLVIAHAMQGVVCLPLLFALWPSQVAVSLSDGVLRAALPEAVLISLPYLLGQIALFWALRYTDASRVSPLLGLKVALVAVATVTLLDEPITSWQWAAVGMTVVAAFVLNFSGGSMPWQAIVGVLVACAGYLGSDVGIQRWVDALGGAGVGRLHASAFGVALSYTGIGAVAACSLPWLGARPPRAWRDALPYAAAWLGAMFCFFGAVALVGLVLSNILQATRGVVSIGLGALLSARGLVHLEAKVDRLTFWRRVAAAVLMVAAVAVYVAGGADAPRPDSASRCETGEALRHSRFAERVRLSNSSEKPRRF